jgi:hypothetical protein
MNMNILIAATVLSLASIATGVALGRGEEKTAYILSIALTVTILFIGHIH